MIRLGEYGDSKLESERVRNVAALGHARDVALGIERDLAAVENEIERRKGAK